MGQRLGTPISGNLINCTGYVVSLGSITGLGTGVATFLATPSSANLRGALTDETGTGAAVFGTSPTITTPNIVGTATNNDATAGSVGEFVSASVALGAAVTLSSTTTSNITSISLTAGDWDVSATGYVVGAGSPTITYFEVDVTQASATSPFVAGAANQIVPASPLTVIQGAAIPLVRQSLSGTTTVYLTANAGFSGGTSVKAFGFIGARRVR